MLKNFKPKSENSSAEECHYDRIKRIRQKFSKGSQKNAPSGYPNKK